jgi:Tfp pilus assembly protein PilX
MKLRNRLRSQDGFALIVALIVLSLFMIIGAAVIDFSSANERDAARSRSRVQTHANAEGGVAAGLARIYNAVQNPNFSTGYTALNPTILPSSRSAALAEAGQPVRYENGYAYYWGTLNGLTGEWVVTSEAHERNPNGGTDLVRTVVAKLTVQTSSTAPANTDAWNWIYGRHVGYSCDMVIQNPGDVNTNIYAEGNLCVENTASLMGTPSNRQLVVKGNLTLRNPQNQVGTATSKVAVHLAGWCKWRNFAQHDPCHGPSAPANSDNVFASTLDKIPPAITWPQPDWNSAYLNANPGPYHPCEQTSGTPPPFDNDQGPISAASPTHMNGSVGTVLLTPNTAYTCKTAAGELSWTPGNPGTLTIRGTIFIDGNAEILNNTLVDYNGTASIYVQGNLYMTKATVCAVFNSAKDGCDNAPWNPNAEFLLFVVSAQAFVGDDDIQIVSTKFQGGLMASNDIDIGTTSKVAGPMLGDYLFIGQTAGTSYPNINLVPTGTPGTPLLITTASTPKIYG